MLRNFVIAAFALTLSSAAYAQDPANCGNGVCDEWESQHWGRCPADCCIKEGDACTNTEECCNWNGAANPPAPELYCDGVCMQP